MNLFRFLDRFVWVALLTAALTLTSGAKTAHAGEKLFDEMRFEQSLYWDDGEHPEYGSFAKAMVFFDPFDSAHATTATDFIFSPRVHVGAIASLAGGTSQVFTGLDWTFDISDKLFLDVGAGATVHNGDLDWSATTTPKLGSRLLFWHYYALGVRVDKNWSLIASWDHSSHADLCDRCANQGLTHIGLSLGYKF